MVAVIDFWRQGKEKEAANDVMVFFVIMQQQASRHVGSKVYILENQVLFQKIMWALGILVFKYLSAVKVYAANRSTDAKRR
ncbi:hypothetical protein Tco_0195522 [Tanacetum coccineum]